MASKPAIAFERMIWHMGFLIGVPSHRRNLRDKPGEYIQRMPKELRDQLKQLKSSDLQNVSDFYASAFCQPPGYWGVRDYFRRGL